MKNINHVQKFWEANPLWAGESKHKLGSIKFFEEHKTVYISDCFAGNFDFRFLPPSRSHYKSMRLLDLGCGIGFWVSEFGLRGFNNLHAADLTKNALKLTRKRLAAYGLTAKLSQQNAERLTFASDFFDHVNCQGVIHHTPDTKAAIAEIARVLKPGGTASISVYYHNPILKLWPYLRWLGWLLAKLGGGLKGRGREKIFLIRDVEEIVRLYDGDANPIGKTYSRDEFEYLLKKYFVIKETYLHFFPARSLPFKIPVLLHRWLDKHLGFMIYSTVQKVCAD